MSTRAMIARRKGDGFEGVYHHFDGYPEGLGQTLWQLAQQPPDVTQQGQEKGIAGLLDYLIDQHPAGWSTINSADWSKPAGYVNGTRTDPGPECYCHGDRSEPPSPMDQDSADWLFIEWAYVFDADARTMAVIKGLVHTGETHTEHFKGRDYEADTYTYTLAAVFPLDGPEPIWETVSDLGYAAVKRAEQARKCYDGRYDEEEQPS